MQHNYTAKVRLALGNFIKSKKLVAEEAHWEKSLFGGVKCEPSGVYFTP